jgi:multiple sugar transport system permease protein
MNMRHDDDLVVQKIARAQRRRAIRPYVLVLPGIAILTAFFFIPSLYNVWTSLQEINLFQLRDGGTFVGIDNYIRLFRDARVGLALINTVWWLTMVTVVVRVLMGLTIALLVNSAAVKRWKLSGFSRSCLLIPWVTPEVVAVAAWQWMLHPRFGALNQLMVNSGLITEGIPFLVQTSTVWFAIAVILVWRELPFVAISILAGLQSIPLELYESAEVEGASKLQLLQHVTLPLLKPVLGIIGLLITIWTFNNFLYVWLATRGGPGNYTQVLATELYTQAFTNYRLGYGAALGVFMTAVMVAFSIIYFKTVFRRTVEEESR